LWAGQVAIVALLVNCSSRDLPRLPGGKDAAGRSRAGTIVGKERTGGRTRVTKPRWGATLKPGKEEDRRSATEQVSVLLSLQRIRISQGALRQPYESESHEAQSEERRAASTWADHRPWCRALSRPTSLGMVLPMLPSVTSFMGLNPSQPARRGAHAQ
jgi:hypothetical protein